MTLRRRKRRSGVTLMEVAVATFLVGLLLAGAMRTLGASLKNRQWNRDYERAVLLAQDLMAEILEQKYVEPVDVAVFGPEPNEINGTRSLFDDVDDYHNWDSTPPNNRDGTTMPNLTGWRRQVKVEYVDPTNLTSVVLTDQGVKRITITISRSGKTLATFVAVRTKAFNE